MEKFIYIFIEVDLWLILFFKVENSGGMGDVLESAILIYLHLFRDNHLTHFSRT